MHRVPICALLSMAALSAAEGFPVIASSTYLGGPGDDDAVMAAAIQADGDIVVALRDGGGTPAAAGARVLAGPATGSAVVLILAPDGRSVKRAVRVGDDIRDLKVDGDDRIVVALGVEGAMGLDAEAAGIRWSIPASATTAGVQRLRARAHRVAVSSAGRVAVLESEPVPGGQRTDIDPGRGLVILLDRDGMEQGRFPGATSKERNVLDLVIDEVGGTVITCGWRQAARDYFVTYDAQGNETGRDDFAGPVQIGFLFGYGFDGTLKWRGYDWGTNPKDPATYLNEIGVASRNPDGSVSAYNGGGNMADTRFYRIALAPDRTLVMAGHAAGGNHLYRHSPIQSPISASTAVGSRLADYDPFTNYSGAKDQHLGFVGRYQLTDRGPELISGQGFVARLDVARINSCHSEGGGIAVAGDNQVLLGGQSAWGLPMWPNSAWTPKPGETAFNPFSFSDYLGGAFFSAIRWGDDGRFIRRDYTTRVAFGGTRTVAARVLADGTRIVVHGGRTILADGPIYLRDPLQPEPGYGREDGFLVVHRSDAVPDAGGMADRRTIDMAPGVTTPPGTNQYRLRGVPVTPLEREFDGDAATVDRRILIPWSATAPLTPRISGAGRFDGTMVYGGWVLDVRNVNPSTPLAGRLSPRVFRSEIPELYLGLNGLPGESLRARAALFMDPREEVGSAPGDRFSFDTSSQISARFAKFYTRFLYSATEYAPGRLFIHDMHLRFLVRDGDRFYISKTEQGWQQLGANQSSKPNVLAFSDESSDGLWAEWDPAAGEDMAFDAGRAVFAVRDFQDITGIGFLIQDQDWRSAPWTGPVPGSDPPTPLLAKDQFSTVNSSVTLDRFTAILRANAEANLEPVPVFSADRTVVRVGEAVRFDAGASSDADGRIAFTSWFLGVGSTSSGPVVEHRYPAAGRYTVRCVVYDDRRASSSTERVIEVVRADAADAEVPRIVASWWGDHDRSARTNNGSALAGKDEEGAAVMADLDRDGRADDLLQVRPYEGIENPLTTDDHLGTRLIGGFRLQTRDAGAVGTSGFLAWPTTGGDLDRNPAGWTRNGVLATAFGFQFNRADAANGDGIRFTALMAVDKEDFVNGGRTLPVRFAAGSRIAIGPFFIIGPRTGTVRAAVRDGRSWFVSETTLVPDRVYDRLQPNLANKPTHGFAVNPSLVIADPRGERWAAWDPVAGGPLPATGFATRTFADITAVGTAWGMADWFRTTRTEALDPDEGSGLRCAGIELQAATGKEAVAAPEVAIAVAAPATAPGSVIGFSLDRARIPAGVSSVLWEFGNGAMATTTDPAVAQAFAAPGTYRVRATVVDAFNRTATGETVVVISAPGVAAPVLTLRDGRIDAEEGSTALIVAERTGSTVGTVSAELRLAYGPGAGAGDHASVPRRISWASGEGGTKAVAVAIVDDADPEPVERITATLADPIGGAVIGDAAATAIDIAISDAAGAFVFARASATVATGATRAVAVRRTLSATGPVGVALQPGAGIAVAPTALFWPDGDATDRVAVVTVLDDGFVRPARTGAVALVVATGGAVVGSPATLAIAIPVSDPALGDIADLVVPATAAEGASIAIAVHRTGTAGLETVLTLTGAGAVAADLDLAGWTPGTGTVLATRILRWEPGDGMPRSLRLPVVDDAVRERSPEGLRIAVARIAGPALERTVAIDPSDPVPGTARMAAAGVVVAEGATAAVAVVRTGGADGPLTVAWTLRLDGGLSAADLVPGTATAGVLAWADGDAATRTISLAILDDPLNEPVEGATVVLGAGGADRETAVQVAAGDAPPPPGASGGGGGGGCGLGSALGAWLLGLWLVVRRRSRSAA